MSKTPKTNAFRLQEEREVRQKPERWEKFAENLEEELNNEIEELKTQISDLKERERVQAVAELIEDRDGWREAAYSLAEALPPSWEELQPPAEQLRKFKEMVQLQNKKTEKLLDNADKHSKMYP